MLVRLSVDVRDGGSARQIAEQLGEVAEDGADALATSWFEEDGGGRWRVDAFYEAMPDRSAILARIGTQLPVASLPAFEEVPDLNWVALSQAALPPVVAGRFVVFGAHDRDRVGRPQGGIEIEAGEAFGTAHHATTQGCLKAIDRLARRHAVERVLDLGCGTGILAIAAARAWPSAVIVASDIDAVAVDVARGNIAHNRERARIRLVTASGLEHTGVRRHGPFDLVLANILAGPLIRLAPGLARVTSARGKVVLSGILGEQAREVVAVYLAAGFRLLERHLDHNWATLVLERSRPPRCGEHVGIGGRPYKAW